MFSMFLQRLPLPSDPDSRVQVLARSAVKSVIAGVAGAVLTNPMDVVRNEMFKTDLSLVDTVRKLHGEMGLSFLARGVVKNLTAVAVPIATTIFLTDTFVRMKRDGDNVTVEVAATRQTETNSDAWRAEDRQ